MEWYIQLHIAAAVAGAAATPWSQRGHDAQRTGMSPFMGPSSRSPQVAWEVTGSNSVYSSCVVTASGVSIWGSWDNEIRAVRVTTGVSIWSVPFSTGDSSPALSPNGNVVYIGSEDNTVPP